MTQLILSASVFILTLALMFMRPRNLSEDVLQLNRGVFPFLPRRPASRPDPRIVVHDGSDGVIVGAVAAIFLYPQPQYSLLPLSIAARTPQ